MGRSEAVAEYIQPTGTQLSSAEGIPLAAAGSLHSRVISAGAPGVALTTWMSTQQASEAFPDASVAT